MTTSVIGAEMSETHRHRWPVPKCPTDISAPVPKCLDAEVSVHHSFRVRTAPPVSVRGALAAVHHPPYFGYIHLHSCKHKTVTLKLTLTLTLTLTDTGGAVLYRLGSGLRNTAGGELQQERPVRVRVRVYSFTV